MSLQMYKQTCVFTTEEASFPINIASWFQSERIKAGYQTVNSAGKAVFLGGGW
jgi:hypothetical protein